MASTTVGVVVRQHGWFRPLLDLESLDAFPVEKIDVVPIQPTGAFRARVLVGRGPVERELTQEFLLWFDHGEEEYPVFQSPSIGPRGAALKLTSKPRRIVISADEALGLIEISLVQPVPASFRDQYQGESQNDAPESPAAMVHRWLSEAKIWLEQAVGLYALYQYPVVWEPLGVHPVVGFVDLEAKTFQMATRIEPDNFIPFRLRVDVKMRDGQLDDNGLIDLSRLENRGLHFPLFLLQRALWQRNIQLRFLETFLLLDYLTGQSGVEDPGRPQREDLYEILDTCVRRDHPEHEQRVKALKHVVLQAPLRERLDAYLRRLEIEHSDEGLRRMLRIRNDLAHARPVDEGVLAQVELEARTLAREVMRRELASQGITFDGASSPSS